MWRAGCFNGRPGFKLSALRREDGLKEKSDLYNGGSRQVTSATYELCAPASPCRSRDMMGEEEVREARGATMEEQQIGTR